jgi:hypothetical protein
MLLTVIAGRLSGSVISMTASAWNRRVGRVAGAVTSYSTFQCRTDHRCCRHSVRQSVQTTSLRRQSHSRVASHDDVQMICRSPHPDVNIDSIRTTALPHYVMNDFHKYHDHVAMVSTEVQLVRLR